MTRTNRAGGTHVERRDMPCDLVLWELLADRARIAMGDHEVPYEPRFGIELDPPFVGRSLFGERSTS